MILLSACSRQPAGDDVVASYAGQKLLRAEVDHFLPDSVQGADSARLAAEYISQWTALRAVAEKAALQIPDLDAELQHDLDLYRLRLAEEAYFKRLASQNAARFEPGEADIRSLYEQERVRFTADANYYRCLYVKTSKPNQFRIVSLMRNPDAAALQELAGWAQTHAEEFRLDSSYIDDRELDRIGAGFPGNIRNASAGTPYPYTTRTDSTAWQHIFCMQEVVKAGSPMPLALCRDRIAGILRNQRVQAYVEQHKAGLVREAQAAGKIRIGE
ncbi:MAG: hypothetical protein NW241_06785 [Bacteroidia bacterium]|nr:hypothetical protein [Bacteroidia bacterium]